MRDWGKRKKMTLSQQFLFLRACQTCNGEGQISRRKLTWRFCAQPSPLSREYAVRLEYEVGDSPDVFVESPELELLAAGREIPHIYLNPLRLCLYLPSSDQWAPQKRLDQTIVPWTYTWLYYFEDWLAFGAWRGGGQHPVDEPEDRGNRQLRRAMSRR